MDDEIETTDSARVVDNNGYITIGQQPISREGVFKYLGKSIGAPDPDRIYHVYRPAEELAKQACLDSFKLLPLIDDHTMLGPSKLGFTPAEKKGVHGTTGDQVDFRDGVLYSNFKIYSESLAQKITSGKKDLSLGYRCRYDFTPGTFAGQAYDAVQRNLTGNHLALVDKARSYVSVLDESQITTDSIDLSINPEDMKMPMTPEEMEKRFAALDSAVSTLTTENTSLRTALDEAEEKLEKMEKKAEDEGDDDEKKKKDDADKKAEDEGDDPDKKDKDDDKKTMDAMDAEIKSLRGQVTGLQKDGVKAILKEVTARDSMAKKLSYHVGTFDASEMTLDDVAAYGVEKLGLKGVAKGQEKVALDGFFHNRALPTAQSAFAMDSAGAKSGEKLVNEYFKPSK